MEEKILFINGSLGYMRFPGNFRYSGNMWLRRELFVSML